MGCRRELLQEREQGEVARRGHGLLRTGEGHLVRRERRCRGGQELRFTGKDYKRTEDGKVIINPESGLPVSDDKTHTLGNATWDWTGGFYSTFSYKNFRLSAGFDVKVGADLFSMSMRSAYATGKASETLVGREEWLERL